MNQLAPMSPVPSEMSKVDPTLHVLERLMRDPSIPIERIERVVAMIDGRELQAAKRSFSQAMALAQEELRPIAADCTNPQTRSRYASLGAVDKAIRPIYSKHGLFPSFNTAPSERGPEWIKVLCEVAHRDGYSREYSIDMPADGKGARGNDVMTRTHATGSAVTYGRRYLLLMIFNLSIGDDDGNLAGVTNGNGNGHLTDEQIDELRSAIVEAGADIGRFCKVYGIERVEDLPARKLSEAKAKLATFKQRQQGAQS